MLQYRTVLSEPPVFLIRLYDFKDFFQELEDKSSELYDFVTDPYHFEYKKFEARWWPLLKFSDLAIPAMRYGRDHVISAISSLDEESRECAQKYVERFTEKDDTDPSDIFCIPQNVGIKRRRSRKA